MEVALDWQWLFFCLLLAVRFRLALGARANSRVLGLGTCATMPSQLVSCQACATCTLGAEVEEMLRETTTSHEGCPQSSRDFHGGGTRDRIQGLGPVW